MSSRLLRFFVAPPDDAPSASAAAPLLRGSPAFAPPLPPLPPPGVEAREERAASAQRTAGGRPPGDVVGLADTRDVLVGAGGLAAGVRQVRGSVVACVWPPDAVAEPLFRPPSSPATVRLTSRLAAHGLAAAPSGAVACVRLDDDPGVALAEVRRAQAIADGPIAIVLARRTTELDVLLRDAATVVVMTAGDPDLVRLAVAELRLVNPSTVTAALPVASLSRLRHRLGLAGIPAGEEAPRRRPAHAATRAAR